MTEKTEISRIDRLIEAVRKAREGDFSFNVGTSCEHDDLNVLEDEMLRLVSDLHEEVSRRKAAEKERDESKEKCRRLQANIPGMVYTFAQHPDGSFSFPYVNEATKDLFDISPDELIADASLITRLIHPDDRKRFALSVKVSGETQQPWREVVRHVVNGEVRWYDCMSRPELQANGDILWDGIILEITDRKRADEALQASNDLLRAVIEAAPTAIIGLDLDGNVRDVWNTAAEKMLGWSADEVMGRPLPSVPLDSQEEFRRFREWIRSGKTMDGVEVSRRRRDGTPIDYSIYASPLYDREGSISGNIAVLVDITERKRADEALRESENRFRLIVETATEGIWQVDREWRTIYVNRRMEEMLGCEPGSMQGLQIQKFMDDEGRRALAGLIANREAGLRETHDFRFVRRDGSPLDALVSATPLLDECGEFVGSFAMVTDITDRKRNENELRLSQYIIDTASMGIFQGGDDSRILSVNEYWAKKLGYTCEELCRLTFFDIDPNLTRDRWREHRNKLTATGYNSFESVHRRKDGTTFPVEITVNYLQFQGRDFSCSFAKDITDRKQADEALRASEQGYRDIVEHAPFGICHSTREGKLLSANPALARILKYDSAEELLATVNRSSIKEVLFADPPRRGPMLERIFATDSWQVFENRYRCRDGSVVTCEVHSRRIPDQGRDGNEFESFLENITYRLEAEHALRESEEKFRVLAETSPTAIILYQGNDFVYVNPAACRLFGYSEAELLEMKFWEWAHPEHHALIMSRGIARQQGEPVPRQYEHKFVNKAGEKGWVVVSAGRIEYHGKPAGIATFVDITESKRIEEKLQASLAEKEVLLKEVHHRVKNNLQIISSLLELQADYIHEEHSRNFIRESQERIRSMALVHEQLYKSVDLSYIDFGRYMTELVTFLYQSHVYDKERINITIDAGNVELAIDDAIPCGLIINELVANAFKHAFPEERAGEILVSCARDEHGTVCLAVVDNGIGLPPGVDLLTTDSLGLQIVGLLTKQLNGTLEMHGEGGVSVAIRFKDLKGAQEKEGK